MKLRVDLAQPAQLDARINLGRSDRSVAKHFLHHVQIGTTSKQMSCKAVTQSMRADVAVQAGGEGVLFDDAP